MSTLDDHDEFMRSALATWVLLTAAGYPADTVYFVARNATTMSSAPCEVLIEVQLPDRKAYQIRVGVADYAPSEAFARWTKIGEAWRSGAITDADMTAFLTRSPARTVVTTALVRAMLMGYGPPNPTAN